MAVFTRIVIGLAFLVTLFVVVGAIDTAFAQGPAPAVAPPASAKGAPRPIAGAGLPVLAIGYGVYWLVKRRRKAD
jgi:hypothetical protein